MSGNERYADEVARMPEWGDDHDHGPRVVLCAGCGEQRWCGIGACRKCDTVTPCLLAHQPGDLS